VNGARQTAHIEVDAIEEHDAVGDFQRHQSGARRNATDDAHTIGADAIVRATGNDAPGPRPVSGPLQPAVVGDVERVRAVGSEIEALPEQGLVERGMRTIAGIGMSDDDSGTGHSILGREQLPGLDHVGALRAEAPLRILDRGIAGRRRLPTARPFRRAFTNRQILRFECLERSRKQRFGTREHPREAQLVDRLPRGAERGSRGRASCAGLDRHDTALTGDRGRCRRPSTAENALEHAIGVRVADRGRSRELHEIAAKLASDGRRPIRIRCTESDHRNDGECSRSARRAHLSTP
jgi:hypothetical protein